MASTTYFLINPPKNLLEWVGGLCLGGLGGLLPDIDHESSKITKKLGLIGKMISKICPHRGITHTFFLWMVLWGGLFYWNPLGKVYWLCGFLGCCSHLLLDAMTISGVRMFSPLSRKKIRFCKIHTGSGLESLVCVLLWLDVIAASCLLLRNLFFSAPLT